MLRILANPEIKSLHAYSIKLIVLILETFYSKSPFNFLGLVTEIINSLCGKIFLNIQNFFKYSKDF